MYDPHTPEQGNRFIVNVVNAVKHSGMLCWLMRKLLPALSLCRFLLLVLHVDIENSNIIAFKQAHRGI